MRTETLIDVRIQGGGFFPRAMGYKSDSIDPFVELELRNTHPGSITVVTLRGGNIDDLYAAVARMKDELDDFRNREMAKALEAEAKQDDMPPLPPGAVQVGPTVVTKAVCKTKSEMTPEEWQAVLERF